MTISVTLLLSDTKSEVVVQVWSVSLLLYYPSSTSSSAPTFLKLGEAIAVMPVTKSVPMPPLTTENTGPYNSATPPDSRPPSSFDALTNTPFTADTLPRIASGVINWTSVCRMTMLTLSNAPVKTSIANDNQKFSDIPNTMVAMPNPATVRSRFLPAFFIGGKCASVSAIIRAPHRGC